MCGLLKRSVHSTSSTCAYMCVHIVIIIEFYVNICECKDLNYTICKLYLALINEVELFKRNRIKTKMLSVLKGKTTHKSFSQYHIFYNHNPSNVVFFSLTNIMWCCFSSQNNVVLLL